MFSASRRTLAAGVFSLLLRAISGKLTALSVTPSTNWSVGSSLVREKLLTNVSRYGDDGTWSAVSIRVGTPPQWVDVMVSTLSSEIWVIGTGGCDNSEWEISFPSMGSAATKSRGRK